MHELRTKQGGLSDFFKGVFLVFNGLMATTVFLNFIAAGPLLQTGLDSFCQNIWMPGAVILGMLALVTRRNNITVYRRDPYDMED